MGVITCAVFLLALAVSTIAAPAPALAQSRKPKKAKFSAGACNIEQISQRIHQDPRDANAYVTRAACRLSPSPWLRKPPLQNVESAVSDLEIALKLDPQNYYAHHNYAHAAYLLGFDAFAIGEFTKAIALNPKSARSYLGRGWANSNLCRMNDMAADFAQAERLDPALESEAANPEQIALRKNECAHPPARKPAPRNCPKPDIFAFSLNARLLLESEWKTQHPGCPL